MYSSTSKHAGHHMPSINTHWSILWPAKCDSQCLHGHLLGHFHILPRLMHSQRIPSWPSLYNSPKTITYDIESSKIALNSTVGWNKWRGPMVRIWMTNFAYLGMISTMNKDASGKSSFMPMGNSLDVIEERWSAHWCIFPSFTAMVK